METVQILPGQDAEAWCAGCDHTHIGPGVLFRTVFGTVVTGRESTQMKIRQVYGEWLGVRFFLCDDCVNNLKEG